MLTKKTELRESLLSNAGLGLFATRDIRKGDVVTEYGGEVVDHAYATLLLRTKQDSHLRCIVPMFQALDGRVRGSTFTLDYYNDNDLLGSFANSSDTANVKYFTCRRTCGRVHPYGGVAAEKVVLKATRSIAKGEEIYVNYGISYNKRHLSAQ